MTNKEIFLKKEFTGLLVTLSTEAKGKWGVMNAQQMVEHMSDALRNANNKDSQKIALTPEQVEKAYGFMMTDKPFKENTKNILLSDVPPPFRNKDMASAIAELQKEIDDFFKVFEENPTKRITNPFFGDLNFEEWLHLLYKHATHHARQFSLIDY